MNLLTKPMILTRQKTYPNNFFRQWTLILWAVTEVPVLLHISNGIWTYLPIEQVKKIREYAFPQVNHAKEHAVED